MMDARLRKVKNDRLVIRINKDLKTGFYNHIAAINKKQKTKLNVNVVLEDFIKSQLNGIVKNDTKKTWV